ncbi:MAG: hypothetical protein C4293_16960 [Nitrospiraceae bacterium]
MIFARLRSARARLMREIRAYRLLIAEPRVPRPARWLLGLAVGYALSPIDLIPDCIPVIGHLDDLVVIPLLVTLALTMIPRDVLEDCRHRAGSEAG